MKGFTRQAWSWIYFERGEGQFGLDENDEIIFKKYIYIVI